MAKEELKSKDITNLFFQVRETNNNGIFSVDMTYDRDGIPNPTEINIITLISAFLFWVASLGRHGPTPRKD